MAPFHLTIPIYSNKKQVFFLLNHVAFHTQETDWPRMQIFFPLLILQWQIYRGYKSLCIADRVVQRVSELRETLFSVFTIDHFRNLSIIVNRMWDLVLATLRLNRITDLHSWFLWTDWNEHSYTNIQSFCIVTSVPPKTPITYAKGRKNYCAGTQCNGQGTNCTIQWWKENGVA